MDQASSMNPDDQPPYKSLESAKPSKGSRPHIELALLVLCVAAGSGLALNSVSSSFKPPSQTKARMSEAKIALAAVYGAEKAYYSEHATYIESFPAIGYAPEGLRRNYAVGFPTNCFEKRKISIQDGILSVANSQFAAGREQEILNYFRSVRPTSGCRDLNSDFEVYAVGINQKDGPLDIWRIDSKKKREHYPDSPDKITLEERVQTAFPGLLPTSGIFAFALFLFGPYGLYKSIAYRRESSPASARIAFAINLCYYALLAVLFVASFGAPNF